MDAEQENNTQPQQPENRCNSDNSNDIDVSRPGDKGRRRSESVKSLMSNDSDSDINLENAPEMYYVTNTDNNLGSGSTSHALSANANQSDIAGTTMWKEDLSNLLTPQTVMEQAQVRRRKRNREAARRSRQRQKERERELVEKQSQLSERLRFLQQELVEWRMINSTTNTADTESTAIRLIDPADVSNSEDGVLAENINSVYALTMETLHIIGELQLQLDEITKELNSMIDPE
ncbi:hypothetical protein LPJ53_001773 [Coemansia erecta]|uniref:BZIP domain-containing protein n=1 Tax=Coemansia erecta TaxID=147472 RepID=A0A9W7Y3C0_9FUNG|nr:hypothetical protein LPJ53_001773 [Coemansia erecta]